MQNSIDHIKTRIFDLLKIKLQCIQLTEGLISECCMELGLHKNHYLILFRDISTLVEFFEEYLDQQMEEQIFSMDLPVSITSKITTCLKARILSLNKSALQNLMNFYLNPSRLYLGVKVSSRTSSLIWNIIGDTSLDYNYYSKRGILLGVYIRTIHEYLNSTLDDEQLENIIYNNLVNTIATIKNMKKIISLKNIPFIRLML